MPGETRSVTYPGYGSSSYTGAGRGAHTSEQAAYGYAGYYATPRLAVQAGVQYAPSTPAPEAGGFTFIDAAGRLPQTIYNHRLDAFDLALPLQVRYALTRSFVRHLQVEAVGGLTPVWSRVHFREYGIENYQQTTEVVQEFSRNAYSLHAQLGCGLSYGFGRRRRVQATAEYVLVQDLNDVFTDPARLQPNGSLGLRYRFGYQ